MTDLSNALVIGISSRALFDLEEEDQIFRTQGLDAYREHQIANEHVNLKPGTGFRLVRALLNLNLLSLDKRLIEVVIMSRNSSETSLRIFNSIKSYGLDITRAALTGGARLSPYLHAFNVSLFLSLHRDDVLAGLNSGIASAILYPQEPNLDAEGQQQIRIAFDGDAVIFSDEAERIYREQGRDAFARHEQQNASLPLSAGPFAPFLKAISFIQQHRFFGNEPAIRTALVTARASPSHERVVRTLRDWGVVIDETFFLGGLDKSGVLAAFNPHIFFDDKDENCISAGSRVPTGQVPYDHS